MAPTLSAAKIQLSYPLYSADFDPEDSRYLLVGGGGGEGRSGVGNKLTLLDTGTQGSITELAELDLSRDEDSVTSLAITRTQLNTGIVALAGINSSTEEQKAGKNEHLRAFRITYPKPSTFGKADRRAQKETTEDGQAHISLLSKSALFTPSSAVKKETYQRVLRLSPRTQRGASEIGVVATGLAPQGELLLFDSSSVDDAKPLTVKHRISLEKGEEAADIDIIESAAGKLHITYCTDFEVSVYCVTTTQKQSQSSASSIQNPRFVWVTPHADVFTAGRPRSTFRALRYLTPKFILLLSNRPGRSGAELSVLELGQGMGKIVQQHRLHRSMKAAVGLDVTVLENGLEKQIVVAVAGQDISIELFTISCSSTGRIGKLRPYCTLRDVHPLQITKICISSFPARTTTESVPSTPNLKLASVSMGNTVVVHTLPLSQVSRGPKPKYVLKAPSSTPKNILSATASVIGIILVAIFFQAFIEIRGGTPPYLGAAEYLPLTLRGWLAKPYIPEAEAKVGRLGDTINNSPMNDGGILISDTGTNVEKALHEDEATLGRHGKKWEDLSQHEREHWKRRLIDAGEWAADEGETILKGVFFGALGGIVGDVVGG